MVEGTRGRGSLVSRLHQAASTQHYECLAVVLGGGGGDDDGVVCCVRV